MDLALLAKNAVASLVQSGIYTPPPRPTLHALPTAYPLQAEIINHPARYKVVCAGRRVGKTIMAALTATNYFLQGKRILLSSTSQDQADAFWDYVKDWYTPLRADGLYKNETKRSLAYRSGYLRVKTGSQPDKLRGGYYDLIVLDECAYLEADAWHKVGAPMLLDTHGKAVFITTPKRRNWFFTLYQQAVTDTSGDWQVWNFSSHANPYLTKQDIDALAQNMSESDYKQEIMAQFLEGDGAVFRYVAERSTASRVEPYAGTFVAGVDFAQTNDYTVIVVMDKAARRVVDYERFRQADWSTIRARLGDMARRWNVAKMICESNSAGSPNIELLRAEGLPVQSFTTTGQSKPPLIESLVLAFDRGELVSLNDAVMQGELMAYERTVSASGRSQYSAPDGLHDDCVIALALAWYGCQQPRLFMFGDD